MSGWHLSGPCRRVAQALCIVGILGALWSCGKPQADFGTTGPVIKPDTLVVRDSAKAADTLKMATLNMSIGFPVSQLLFKNMKDPEVAFRVLDTLYARYLQGKPTDRLKAMAKAIISLDLDVVGLQEVMKISKNGALINDFLPELVADIKAFGGPDYQAYDIPLNDTALTGKQGALTNTIAFHEGNALLVKPGLRILDTARFIYFTLLPITSANGKPTQRALGYMKLKSPRGIVWQVFTTHLEVFAEISSSQAKELRLLVDSVAIKDRLGKPAAPEIILGDFNVSPGEDAHRVMTEGGFLDLYIPKADSGYSCCVAGSALWTPDTTFSNRRIDFIFAKHLVNVLNHQVALDGAVITDSGQRILATDHRMVWTRVVGQ